MENKEINTKVRLESKLWRSHDEDRVSRPFIRAGFDNTQEILDLRVYDMLNILGIDRVMAEEMMYALYRLFNENKDADDALYDGFIDQFFDYAEWREEHPDPSMVHVKDIVMAGGMNMEALCWLFDRTVKRFWKSPEYSREYRYWGYKDLMDQMAKEKAQ